MRYFFLSLLVAFPARAEENRLSFPDLQALEKNAAWEELLQHLEDIPEERRDEKWNQMGEKAAVKYLNAISTDQDPFAALTAADGLTKRHAFLRKSKKVKDARIHAGLEGFDTCLGLSYSGAGCIERILTYVDKERGASELAFRAGKAVIRHGEPASAIPLFQRFLIGNVERVECQDDGVVRSVLAALALPKASPLAVGAREIAARHCPDSLRPFVIDLLAKKKKGSEFAHNVCGFLKESGDLGKAENECGREKQN